MRYLLIFICALIFACWPAFAQSAKPSAFTFVKPSTYNDVSMSPNGDYVAYLYKDVQRYCQSTELKYISPDDGECKEGTIDYQTRQRVDILDLESSKRIKIFEIPRLTVPIGVNWANNDRLLVNLYRYPSIDGNVLILGGTRIVSVPVQSDDIAHLFSDQLKVARQNWNLSQITNPLRDDPEHIIMPANKNGDLDLWKVNVVNGHAERIATGKNGTFFWYTDRRGNAVMRFDCKGSRCRKINVYTPKDDAEGKWEKIKTFNVKPDEDEEDYDFWPVAPTGNPNEFYVLSEEEMDLSRSVKTYNIKTGQFINTVFEHPEFDVSGVLLDLQTGEYSGATYYKDRLTYEFADNKLQKHFDAVNAYFSNKQNVEVIGYNSDGSRAVFYVSAPDNPGEYYVYDFTQKRVELLFERNPELGHQLSSRTDILKIPTRDGNSITAYHSYPSNSTGKSSPFLVMPHGGPELRDNYDFDATAQYFVSRGYQVLQMNFRGSSGYGRAFAESGYGQWGGVMQNDVIDSVNYLYSKKMASPANTCVVGYSYGGYVALHAAAYTTDMFKCVVSGGGVSDLVMSLKQTRKDFGSDSESYQYWLKSIGDPKTDKAKLQAASPVNFAKNFDEPILLLHGENDEIVDIKQTNKMIKALEKAGKQFEVFELKNEGHSDWSTETSIIYLETIEKFLDQHLSGQNMP